MDNNELVNELVYKGLIPIAFANSKIIKIKEEIKINSKVFHLNKVYKQFDLPEPSTQILISKIYDLY